MILVDTSVWIEHLRTGSPGLRTLLASERVLTHPFVIGELACGNMRDRGGILDLLGRLPQARVAGHQEVMAFVGERRLYGRGLGWIDAHLLAAALLSRATLWTRDRPLVRVADALSVTHR
jgi:predicted nucleic acid-binding protein